MLLDKMVRKFCPIIKDKCKGKECMFCYESQYQPSDKLNYYCGYVDRES